MLLKGAVTSENPTEKESDADWSIQIQYLKLVTVRYCEEFVAKEATRTSS